MRPLKAFRRKPRWLLAMAPASFELAQMAATDPFSGPAWDGVFWSRRLPGPALHYARSDV